LQKYLVYEDNFGGPATHALIIGVGQYAHLKDGGGRFSDAYNNGMEQLSSPPVSAREFANWLIKSYNPPKCEPAVRKLGSIAMLVSDKDSQIYSLPSGGTINLERASSFNVLEAISGWDERANNLDDNMTMLFFCGHGAMEESDTALLLEDFAADDRDPMAGALDFSALLRGMHKCKAQRQVYFIDACRKSIRATRDEESMGKIFRPGNRHGIPGKKTLLAVYYSTLAWESAYCQENEVSQFTGALLKAFSSAAGNYEGDGKWRIYTGTLKSGTDALLRREAEKHPDFEQVPAAGETTTFLLHELEHEPLIPVFVYCDPSDVAAEYELTCTVLNQDKKYHRGAKWGWDLELPAPGSYNFTVSPITDPAKKVTKEKVLIIPTHAKVEMKVMP
jgi:hypothetical protein